MPGLINTQMQHAANQGRNGDTRMAHMTPGEMVMPREVAAMRPDLVSHVQRAIAQMGGDPKKYTVGAGRVNPATGVEEFASQEEIIAAYQNQLGRAPDAGGLAYWTAQGNLDGFANGAKNEIAIRDTYQNNFGRPAEQAAYDYWTAQGAGNANYDYAGAIRAGAQGSDVAARNDIAAGGVDTSATWGGGASLTDPNLRYDADKNTWAPSSAPAPKPLPVAAPAPSPAEAATYTGAQAKAANWAVQPSQTVESRIEGIIAKNSPLQQMAESRSLQKANERGLINSNMAVTAGQAALYDAAMPIAAADASTFARAGEANAGFTQQTGLANQASTNNANQFNAGQKNQFGMQANEQTNTLARMGEQQRNNVINQATQQGYNVANLTLQQVNDMARIATTHINDLNKIQASGQVQKDVLAISTAAAASLAETQATYTGLMRASADAAGIWANTQNNIARIMQDKTLDAAGKTQAIDTYNTNARAALQIIGSLAGNVDIARYIDQLLPA